jgi:hypothetical protein
LRLGHIFCGRASALRRWPRRLPSCLPAGRAGASSDGRIADRSPIERRCLPIQTCRGGPAEGGKAIRTGSIVVTACCGGHVAARVRDSGYAAPRPESMAVCRSRTSAHQ